MPSLRYLLDVEPLDLGSDVRAVGLELVEADENREPVRGEDAAKIWSRVLTAAASTARRVRLSARAFPG